jgi:hypothetical protein
MEINYVEKKKNHHPKEFFEQSDSRNSRATANTPDWQMAF